MNASFIRLCKPLNVIFYLKKFSSCFTRLQLLRSVLPLDKLFSIRVYIVSVFRSFGMFETSIYIPVGQLFLTHWTRISLSTGV